MGIGIKYIRSVMYIQIGIPIELLGRILCILVHILIYVTLT